MTKFVCKDCDYRFESLNIKKCPYCGKERVVKELDAEDLSKEYPKEVNIAKKGEYN